MKALQVTELGKSPKIQDIAPIDPAAGEIRIAVEACGLNFADLLMIKGQYQERQAPPFTLGMEIAGTVEAVGDGVTGFATGDRVAAFCGQGGLAELACVPAETCVPLPDTMPATDAAAFQIAYGTSHVALEHRARLQPGETLLVLGAAGGVGLTAVEIGKLMGARVIAVARGADKLAVAERAGADHLIDAESEDLRGQLKALGGVDVIYDAVGGTLCEQAFRACKPEARVLLIGFASGQMPDIKPNHLLVKNVALLGLYWGGYLNFRPGVLTASMATLLNWYGEGRLHPHVSHTLPLAQAEEALELLRSRKSTGKVVVTI